MSSATVLNLPRRKKTVKRYLEIVRYAHGKNQGLVSVANHFRISPATVINASRAFGMSYEEIKRRRSMPELQIVERQLASTKDIDQRSQKIIDLYNSKAAPTMEQIGRRAGLTRQRVHQIIKEAQRKGIKVARRKPVMGHWIERCMICRRMRKLAKRTPLMTTRSIALDMHIPIWKVHWHLNKLRSQELVPKEFGHFRSERIIQAVKLYNRNPSISAWKLGRTLGYKNLPAVFRGLKQRGFGYLLSERSTTAKSTQEAERFEPDFNKKRVVSQKGLRRKSA